MASPKKKDTAKDFQKDNPADGQLKVTASDVKGMATLKNEQTRKILGFLLLVFSAVLFISFISFFFTWKTDQFQAEDDKVSNAMGLLGAALSRFFVAGGFGLGAFAFCPCWFWRVCTFYSDTSRFLCCDWLYTLCCSRFGSALPWVSFFRKLLRCRYSVAISGISALKN